jgi:type I restriction enzyme R subunit
MNTGSVGIRSPNFWFLEEHAPELVSVAAAAERYVFRDPVTTLMRLRQFAEFLAKRAAAHHGIDATDCEFSRLLSMLREQRIVPKNVFEFLDLLRLRGNLALHEGIGDRQTALRGLISAREVSLWFHRTFKDPAFEDGAFRPPSNPTDVAEGFRRELDDLRDEAALYRQQSEAALGRVSTLEQARVQLEQENDSAFQLLTAADERVEELEQRLSEEQQRFEARLASLAAAAKASPGGQMASFVERAKRAAAAIGLRSDEANYVPLTRIRIPAGDDLLCHGLPRLLVQSSTGGFVMANCSVCGSSCNLGKADFFKLDLWISCPTCRTRATPGMVRSNYGYTCPQCGWQCFLASLLPHYTEL